MPERRVLVAGVFDIIHPGHLYLLWRAKELGRVIVVVARDSTAEKVKGRRPIIPESQRLEVVRNLKPVDEAVLGHEGDMLKVVEEVKPDIILLGPNQPFDEEQLRRELERRGLRVEVRRLSEVYRGCRFYSTTQIIEEVLSRWEGSSLRGRSQP